MLILRPSALLSRPATCTWPIAVLALGLLLGFSRPLIAQDLTFRVEMTDAGKEMLADREQIEPDQLAETLSQEGLFVWIGGSILTETRFLVFFVPGDAGGDEVMYCCDGEEPIQMEPGRHPIGKLFPSERFLSMLRETTGDADVSFESWIEFDEGVSIGGGSIEPDFDTMVESLLVDPLRDRMKIGSEQVGVVFALVPVNPKVEDDSAIQISPLGLTLTRQ